MDEAQIICNILNQKLKTPSREEIYYRNIVTFSRKYSIGITFMFIIVSFLVAALVQWFYEHLTNLMHTIPFVKLLLFTVILSTIKNVLIMYCIYYVAIYMTRDYTKTFNKELTRWAFNQNPTEFTKYNFREFLFNTRNGFWILCGLLLVFIFSLESWDSCNWLSRFCAIIVTAIVFSTNLEGLDKYFTWFIFVIYFAFLFRKPIMVIIKVILHSLSSTKNS